MTKTYQKERPKTIQSLFGSIAKSYDRTNSILSLNFHRSWNRALVASIATELSPNRSQTLNSDRNSYLDLCAGTGEISFAVLEASQAPMEAFLLDFSPEMLACAKEKAKKKEKAFEQHQIHYLEADAEAIPLPSKSFDAASIAYGIRNIEHPNKCMKEVFRVLRPGGSFAILELTRPKNPLLRAGHALYLKTVLPLLGEAYRYLSESVRSFNSPSALKEMLEEVGFVEVHVKALTGGIATLIRGKKPYGLT